MLVRWEWVEQQAFLSFPHKPGLEGRGQDRRAPAQLLGALPPSAWSCISRGGVVAARALASSLWPVGKGETKEDVPSLMILPLTSFGQTLSLWST